MLPEPLRRLLPTPIAILPASSAKARQGELYGLREQYTLDVNRWNCQGS
jgi:hypothetical protein